MRWDLLFGDLESQAAALQSATRDAEVDERTRIELGRIRLVERLLPAVGRLIRVSCRGVTVNGTLARVGAQWLLVDEDAHQHEDHARDQAQIELLDGVTVHGTIDRVGLDFFELAVHDVGVARRASEVREIVVVVLAALAVVRRDSDRLN